MLAILTIALLTLLPVAAATAAPAGPVSPSSPSTTGAKGETSTEITVASITPMIGTGDEAIIEGELTNTGDTDLASSTISVIPKEPDSSAGAVREWSEDEDPVSGTLLAESTLEDVPAGETVPFTLTVDGDDLAPGVTVGASWISVQTHDTAVHTFVGIHRAKEYEPLQVVWGVPLLLPADTRLFGEAGASRAEAWQEAVGADSRIADLTADPPAENEAWLLDPTLVREPPEPPDDLPTDEEEAATAEQEVRSERADAIRENLVPEQTIVLPRGDADTAAGTTSKSARRVVEPQVENGARLAEQLDAVGNVVWPADENATQDRSRGYNDLYPGKARPTVLTSDTSFQPAGFTPTGGTRTTGDTPVVVRDSDLSRLVGDLDAETNPSLARQRLIAGTATLLRERPGTPRTVLVVPDRDTTPDPTAYARLRTQAQEIPWLRSGDVTSMLGAARGDTGESWTPRTSSQLAEAGVRGPRQELDAARSRRLGRNLASLTTFASVRSDGETWRPWIRPQLVQVTSARWRGEDGLGEVHDHLTKEVTLTRDELEVSSGDVNFFADTGRLQITVINKTDVELTNLQVDLHPANPSLRFDDSAKTLTIGPDGRQTITVRASALAAARVPVDVTVHAPDGTDLTAPASLHVLVRPTGNVVYWIIGGAAALLLVVGTWRTVRGGRRTKGASRTETERTEESG